MTFNKENSLMDAMVGRKLELPWDINEYKVPKGNLFYKI
jgi:hypothetical protein